VGVGKKYLDESSLRIAYIGDSDEMLQVSFQMVASPKEVASRLRTTPNGELIDISCIGNGVINISPDDLVAFRLPARTKRLSLGFATKGVEKWEVFGAKLSLITGELEIVGKRNTVVDLCTWLNVPITAFN
jgi:hypothetical protein